MLIVRNSKRWSSGFFVLAMAALLLVGYQAIQAQTTGQPATKPTSRPTVRIKAGAATQFTDSSGNVWLADQGFEGGDVTERASDLKIENTKDPALYRSEHYSMESFSYKLPDGKYTVKLHFAETYEENTDKGTRVFSVSVQGYEIKDLDIFVKAGGVQRAYIETVPVEITTGKLEIKFTANVQNPEINGIEIIPAD